MRGAACALLLLAGCGPPSPVGAVSPSTSTSTPTSTSTSAGFSGEIALRRLEDLMGLSRALGDPRRGEAIDALASSLEELGAKVARVEHVGRDPATEAPYALTTIIGHLRPEAPRRFVIATHFDTRPWADEESDPVAWSTPVPGANDGTSGVAVVLELLPLLHRDLPPDVGITAILFDGEELGRPDRGGYCMGSRELAGRVIAREFPRVGCAEFGIVLDMVGDRDLHLLMEPNSLEYAPDLVERVWSTGRRLGYEAFDPTPRGRGIIDDHKFLSEAGIPSILIIDREYDAWHTRADTIERVSAASLEAVGETVRVTLAEYWRDPPAVRDSRACPAP